MRKTVGWMRSPSRRVGRSTMSVPERDWQDAGGVTAALCLGQSPLPHKCASVSSRGGVPAGLPPPPRTGGEAARVRGNAPPASGRLRHEQSIRLRVRRAGRGQLRPRRIRSKSCIARRHADDAGSRCPSCRRRPASQRGPDRAVPQSFPPELFGEGTVVDETLGPRRRRAPAPRSGSRAYPFSSEPPLEVQPGSADGDPTT